MDFVRGKAFTNVIIVQGTGHEGSLAIYLISTTCVGVVYGYQTDMTQWSLVLAGISDFARPAEKLSFTQNFALTCTGLIWTRWCFVIRPKNMLYAPPTTPPKPDKSHLLTEMQSCRRQLLPRHRRYCPADPYRHVPLLSEVRG